MKILIIEDDHKIVETLVLTLIVRWPDAMVVSSNLGEKGIKMVESETPDIVVLDLGLPDISGFDVLKSIRLFSKVPVVILTARAEEADIVKGLELGADDYITKPFRQMELLARLKALMRRQTLSMENSTEDEHISAGKISLSPITRQVTVGSSKIDLTATETLILQRLMKNAGNIVTHGSLAEAVWGSDYPNSADSLKVYIRRLREKIEAEPSEPRIILAKPGVGYLLAGQ